MMAMLEALHVHAGYGGKEVLRGVHLAVEKGEFVAVIGPNGSGKSTLVKCLTGFLRPKEGMILLEGKNITSWKSKERARKLAVLHQEAGEPLPFRVRDYVELGRYPHHGFADGSREEDRESVSRAIARAGIGRFESRKLTELSGGERQMVYLARALAQNPEIIILDEPVSHLDIGHTVSIMDAMTTLNETGVAVLAVLHDINLASDYADRIIALKDGMVFAEGSPSQVMDYRTVEQLFETVCVVRENPLSGKPFVYPVPGKYKR